MTTESRQHFRITYPDDFRPVLIVNGRTYRVIDVSVYGLRFETDLNYLPESAAKFVGTFEFKTGPVVTVKGTVVRRENNDVMIKLTSPVSKDILKAEADNLIERCGEVPTKFY